jgi:hypothetical protein
MLSPESCTGRVAVSLSRYWPSRVPSASRTTALACRQVDDPAHPSLRARNVTPPLASCAWGAVRPQAYHRTIHTARPEPLDAAEPRRVGSAGGPGPRRHRCHRVNSGHPHTRPARSPLAPPRTPSVPIANENRLVVADTLGTTIKLTSSASWAPARMASAGYGQRDRCCGLYMGPAVVTCLEICCNLSRAPVSGPAPLATASRRLGARLRTVSAARVP